MNLIRSLIVSALVPVIAACSGGTEQLQNQANLASEIRTSVTNQRKAEAVPEIVLTRALLDQLATPSLEIVSEKRERTAFLSPFSNRGDVSIWQTVDGSQAVLRQGLLIATRGIGGDLASSDSASTLASLKQRAGSTTRRLFLRNGNSGQDQLTLSCSLQDLGRENLEVVEKVYETYHLRENCRVGSGTITNDYWIETRSGLIRQSRQWVGSEIGYLRLRVLKE